MDLGGKSRAERFLFYHVQNRRVCGDAAGVYHVHAVAVQELCDPWIVMNALPAQLTNHWTSTGIPTKLESKWKG